MQGARGIQVTNPVVDVVTEGETRLERSHRQLVAAGTGV